MQEKTTGFLLDAACHPAAQVSLLETHAPPPQSILQAIRDHQRAGDPKSQRWRTRRRTGNGQSESLSRQVASFMHDLSLDGNRNPLDDVAGHFLLPPVIEPRRPRAGVAGQVLHVIKRHALREQVGDYRDAE